MATRSYTFVFVCQGGPFELKALYLAASLHRYLACEADLVAAVPQDYDLPTPATLAILSRMGVRTVPIRNPLDLAYPIGNKLACLGIPTTADKLVFLDSDMLLVRRFEHQPRFEIAFNAKPCHVQSYNGRDSWFEPYRPVSACDELAGAVAKWRSIYDALGIAIDDALPIQATASGEYGPPYFNAGFIAVDAGAGLDQEWVHCCKVIDADSRVVDKRPWLDQLALPLAVARLGVDVDCLDDRYNHPLLVKPMGPDLPYFCHYHWPRVIRQDQRLVELIESLDEEHPELARERARSQAWAQIGRSGVPRRLPRNVADPDLLVTGIPHAGSRELAEALGRVENCVVFDEPPQIVSALAQARPIRVFGYYRGRRDQLQDRAADVPTVGLKWLDDDEIRACRRRVSRSDFVLATRNDVAYLSRLDAVRRVVPHARVAICVRNPFDTIAAWKRLDPALAAADVARWPVSGVGDPWLAGTQRHSLEIVDQLVSPAVRRAALWNYLAELAMAALGSGVSIIAYHELAADPRRVVAQLVDGWDIAVPPLPPLAEVDRSNLDADDIRAIRAMCSGPAAALGVFEPWPGAGTPRANTSIASRQQ